MEKNKDFWEGREDPLWLNEATHPIMGDQYSRRRRAILEVTRRYYDVMLSAKDILDIGSGGGLNCYFPPELLQSKRITALDSSTKILEANPSGTKILADANKSLPFEDMSFDVITQFFVNRYLVDQRANIREIQRVLKPGGRALILDHEFLFHPLEVRTFEPYEIRVLAVLNGCQEVIVEELFSPIENKGGRRGGLYLVSFSRDE